MLIIADLAIFFAIGQYLPRLEGGERSWSAVCHTIAPGAGRAISMMPDDELEGMRSSSRLYGHRCVA